MRSLLSRALCATAASCLSLVASWGASPQLAFAQQPPPQMQGSWRLNPDLTAKLHTDLSEEGPGTSGKGRGSGRGGGSMSSHGGASGGGPQGWDGVSSGGGDHQSTKSETAILASLEHLTIALAPDQLTITDRDGHPRLVKSDGSKVHDLTAPGGPAEIHATWQKDGALLVEIKPEKGLKHSELYEVADDGKHLYVTVAFPAGFMAHDTKVLRAYDLVPAATPEPAPAKPVAPPTPR